MTQVELVWCRMRCRKLTLHQRGRCSPHQLSEASRMRCERGCKAAQGTTCERVLRCKARKSQDTSVEPKMPRAEPAAKFSRCGSRNAHGSCGVNTWPTKGKVAFSLEMRSATTDNVGSLGASIPSSSWIFCKNWCASERSLAYLSGPARQRSRPPRKRPRFHILRPGRLGGRRCRCRPAFVRL